MRRLQDPPTRLRSCPPLRPLPAVEAPEASDEVLRWLALPQVRQGQVIHQYKQSRTKSKAFAKFQVLPKFSDMFKIDTD